MVPDLRPDRFRHPPAAPVSFPPAAHGRPNDHTLMAAEIGPKRRLARPTAHEKHTRLSNEVRLTGHRGCTFGTAFPTTAGGSRRSARTSVRYCGTRARARARGHCSTATRRMMRVAFHPQLGRVLRPVATAGSVRDAGRARLLSRHQCSETRATGSTSRRPTWTRRCLRHRPAVGPQRRRAHEVPAARGRRGQRALGGNPAGKTFVFAPAAASLAPAPDGTVRLIDRRSAASAARSSATGRRPHGVAFSPRAAELVTPGKDGSVLLWDMRAAAAARGCRCEGRGRELLRLCAAAGRGEPSMLLLSGRHGTGRCGTHWTAASSALARCPTLVLCCAVSAPPADAAGGDAGGTLVAVGTAGAPLLHRRRAAHVEGGQRGRRCGGAGGANARHAARDAADGFAGVACHHDRAARGRALCRRRARRVGGIPAAALVAARPPRSCPRPTLPTTPRRRACSTPPDATATGAFSSPRTSAQAAAAGQTARAMPTRAAAVVAAMAAAAVAAATAVGCLSEPRSSRPLRPPATRASAIAARAVAQALTPNVGLGNRHNWMRLCAQSVDDWVARVYGTRWGSYPSAWRNSGEVFITTPSNTTLKSRLTEASKPTNATQAKEHSGRTLTFSSHLTSGPQSAVHLSRGTRSDRARPSHHDERPRCAARGRRRAGRRRGWRGIWRATCQQSSHARNATACRPGSGPGPCASMGARRPRHLLLVVGLVSLAGLRLAAGLGRGALPRGSPARGGAKQRPTTKPTD